MLNRKLLFFLVLAAILGFLVYRFWGIGFDWALFFNGFTNVHPGWLMVAIVATLLTYLIRAIRWQVLLKPLKSIAIGPLTSSTVVGFAGIYLFGRAGELVRPVWIARREDVPLTAAVATVVVERVFDTLMLILLFAVTLLTLRFPASAEGSLVLMKSAAWLMLAASLGAFAGFFIFRAAIDRMADRFRFRRVAQLMHAFAQGLSFLRDGKSIGLTLTYSLLLWLVIALEFWILMIAMKFDFSFQASTFVMIAVALGSLAQVPGIGGGFQAGYIFCMTSFFHVPAETAVATSLVVWAASYIPTVAVAALYLIFQGMSFRGLRASLTAG